MRYTSDDASVDSSVSMRSMRSVSSSMSTRTPTRKLRVHSNTPTKLQSPTPTKSSLLRMAVHSPGGSPMSVTPNSLPWDEKEVVRNLRRQLSPTGSVSSASTTWSSTEHIKESRKAAHKRVVAARSGGEKKSCDRKWDPTLFKKKRGCVRCLALASKKERQQYFNTGRHSRIAMTGGGCHRGCNRSKEFNLANPDVRNDNEEGTRLCRICFNAVHR